MSKQTPDKDYIWWLLPEKLAGMPRPKLEDLPGLQLAGIQGIVSVMDEPSGIQEYQEQGFQALWLPIQGGTPPSVEQVREFTNFTEQILEAKGAAVVHCTSGNRRTGTLLAAYLIAKGKKPQQAIALVQKVRPTAELREIQKDFLLQLPELIAK